MAEDMSNSRLLRLTDTDTGNAEAMALLHGHYVRYDHKQSRWLIFNGVYWEGDKDGQITRIAIETAKERLAATKFIENLKDREDRAGFARGSRNAGRLRAMLAIAQDLPPIADDGEAWDGNHDLLGTVNGVIYLPEGVFIKGLPDYHITRVSPVKYDPRAQCPRFLRFLQEVFDGDQALIDFMKRWVGYTMTGHTREQKLMMAYGTGANGKSTLINAMQKLAGELAQNLPFATLDLYKGSRFDLGQLPGKRLVTSVETNEGTVLNEARVKALTGGDKITAERKYIDPFEFEMRAKVWLAVNSLPTVREMHHAFWRRILCVPFLQTFPVGGEPDLDEKLEAELPGILNWAIEGAMEWYRVGLQAPDSVMLSTWRYKQEQDVVQKFIDDYCVAGEGLSIRCDIFHDAFVRESGSKITRNAMGRRMGELGYERKRVGRGQMAYLGIDFRGADDDAPENLGFPDPDIRDWNLR